MGKDLERCESRGRGWGFGKDVNRGMGASWVPWRLSA